MTLVGANEPVAWFTGVKGWWWVEAWIELESKTLLGIVADCRLDVGEGYF